MPRPELWIVAGPNGAGKTTLVQAAPISSILPHVSFVNPDDIALRLLKEAGWNGFHDAPSDILNQYFLRAAELSFLRLVEQLRSGIGSGIETVLSTDKYLDLAKDVVAGGGFVGLIYVWLKTPELACARVVRRTRLGGHGVDPDKIVARWYRSVANLALFARHVSAFWVFDNSDSHPDNPPVLVARGADGKLGHLSSDAPEPLLKVLSFLDRS